MRNLEHLIYKDGVLRHVIWVEYLHHICDDNSLYWYEIVNFGKGKEYITGEIECSDNDSLKLIIKLLKKIKQ